MGDMLKSRRVSTASSEENMKLVSGSSGSAISNSKTDKSEEAGLDEVRTSGRRRRSHYSSMKTITSKSSPSDSLRKDSDVNSPSGPTAYLNSVINTLVSENASSPAPDKSDRNLNQSMNGNTNNFRLSQKRKNRNNESGNHHKPAEIFRKDLISAMKIPDTSQLQSEEYWVMRDQWRIEWEKGVQVPVNQEGLPAVKVVAVEKNARGDFRMPRKLIKTTPDVGDRDTVNLNVLADATCRYDLDEVDVAWLEIINQERSYMSYAALDEFTMEHIMEELESQCHENMQLAIKTKEGLGIEYDENIVCDVCRSPDCEEGNEMVFCDGCNLCVHQACYGILKVPEGSWLCKPCALGIRGSAVCILCGRKGGAMKSTKSGRKWAHMNCALWIPEISIADPDRMEPITKVSHIPSSRWALVCSVCKEKSVGACIQCSVRHCVTAYHVTCAMENRFDMITDCPSPGSSQSSNESAIVFRSYCRKHSKNYKKHNSPGKKTEEEKRSDRQKRIAELEEEFFTLVKCESIANALNIPRETAMQVMEYWKMKRKANFNRPLVTPKQEEGKALEEAAETGLQRRLRMFTHLRQDLERVRNLCYMIGKREKMKRSSVKLMSNVFLAQMQYTEYRMSNSPYFDPKATTTSLQTFGMPEILQLAKEESLALTKEWGFKGETESKSPKAETSLAEEIDVRDVKVEANTEDEPRPRKPQISATVTKKPAHGSHASSKEKEHLLKEKSRKNGLITDKILKTAKSENSSKVSSPRRNLLVDINEDKNKKISDSRHRHRRYHHRDAITDSLSEVSNGEASPDTVTKHINVQSTKSKNTEKPSRMDGSFDNKISEKISGIKRRRSTIHTDSENSTVKRNNFARKNDFLERESHRNKTRLKRQMREATDASAMAKSTIEQRKSSQNSDDNDRCAAVSEIHKGDDKKVPSAKKRHSMSQESEKHATRRSSRNVSNSENSDLESDLPSGMTISIETISETKRFDIDRRDDKRRKRPWSKGDTTFPTDEQKKPRIEKDEDSKNKKLHGTVSPLRNDDSTDFTDDDSAFEKSHSVRSRKGRKSNVISRQSPTMGKAQSKVQERKDSRVKSGSSTDETSSRISSKDNRNRPISGQSPVTEKSHKKEHSAKNGRGALASSRAHGGEDKNGVSRLMSGQELDDEDTRLSQKKKDAQISDTNSESSNGKTVSKKATLLNVEEPNPSWKAAGLDVSYGSNCPAALRARHTPSPSLDTKRSLSTGLRWVPLLPTDDNREDNLKYPPCTGTPKDQEGYRGDMDESEDSEYQNASLSHKQHHRKLTKSRKRSTQNPGKHRTGIGVTNTIKPHVSDSSDDDFDLSFSSHPTSVEKSPREKLKSISTNTSRSSLELTHSLPLRETERSKSTSKVQSPKERPVTNNNIIAEPKNARAVGGILDGLKCEPSDPSHTFFPTTTDGKTSRDSFFEKFSYLNEAREDKFSSQSHSNVQLLQTQFGHPDMMTFPSGQLPFQPQSIFPFGTVNINPWQVPHPASALPSIVPNRYAMPVFYQYPPPPPSFHKERNLSAFVSDAEVHHPSPPPMPDSTLSPESLLPASASVAVQASTDSVQSKMPFAGHTERFEDSAMAFREKSTNPINEDVIDNEWEVVADDNNVHSYADDDSRRHRQKHKKKKKKKKRRKLRLPEGYESEKRDVSTPTSSGLPEPTHGAIVPRGQSVRYDVAGSSPVTSDCSLRTEVSNKGPLLMQSGESRGSFASDGFSTAGSQARSDFETRSVDSGPHNKLVLKINKKDLRKDIITSTYGTPVKNTSPDLQNKKHKNFSSSEGIKLTFKKFHPNQSLEKYRKKLRTPGDHYSSYTVSPVAGSQQPQSKPKNNNPALLRRLGLDGDKLPMIIDTEARIGKPALRERKPLQDESGQSQQKNIRIQENKGKNSISETKKQANDSTMLQNSFSEKDLKIKRGRGRPKRIRPPSESDVASKDVPSNAVEGSKSQSYKQKDFAKFAGWSTKSQKSASRMQSRPLSMDSSALSFGKQLMQSDSHHLKTMDSKNNPVRSVSTDSDPALNASINLSPAKHWKKRKVREHETQLSEIHTSPVNSDVMSPPSKSSQKLSIDEDSSAGVQNRTQKEILSSQRNEVPACDKQKSEFLKPLSISDSSEPQKIMNYTTERNAHPESVNKSLTISWDDSGHVQMVPTSFSNKTSNISHDIPTPPTSKSESSPSPLRGGPTDQKISNVPNSHGEGSCSSSVM